MNTHQKNVVNENVVNNVTIVVITLTSVHVSHNLLNIRRMYLKPASDWRLSLVRNATIDRVLKCYIGKSHKTYTVIVRYV